MPCPISVVIPAYNEALRLPPTLTETKKYLAESFADFEIVVVDDGSTDATQQIVRQSSSEDARVRLLALPYNSGKGAAVKSGALDAKGELVLFIDADGSAPITELPKLVAAVNNGADVAIGSRALPSSQTEVSTHWYRKLPGRILNKIINLTVLPGIADTQCGFKLFKASAAQAIFPKQTATGFSFDVEILYIAKLLKLKISEVSINWHHVDGSKVNFFADGFRLIFDSFKFRYFHGKNNPK